MFIGHFAVAFAARRAAPGVSLGVLVAAALWLDLVWPVLLLSGVERVEVDAGGPLPLRFAHYPYSHGLLAVAGWALLWAAVAWVLTRERRTAAVLGALVASHWVLDALVHVPDLPLGFGGAARVGLGLWLHPLPALAFELGLFAAGVALLLRGEAAAPAAGARRLRRPRRRVWALAGFLVLVQLANVFGPPPPGVAPVIGSALAVWLLVAWAAWAERGAPPAAPGGAGGG